MRLRDPISDPPSRIGRFSRPVSAIAAAVAVCATWGCEGGTEPTDDAPREPLPILSRYPTPGGFVSGLEAEVRLLFTEPVSGVTVHEDMFRINDVPCDEVTADGNLIVASWSARLTHNRRYDVDIQTRGSGKVVPSMSWPFTTQPGDPGGNWVAVSGGIQGTIADIVVYGTDRRAFAVNAAGQPFWSRNGRSWRPDDTVIIPHPVVRMSAVGDDVLILDTELDVYRLSDPERRTRLAAGDGFVPEDWAVTDVFWILGVEDGEGVLYVAHDLSKPTRFALGAGVSPTAISVLGDDVVIVGDRGFLLSSGDGGAAWRDRSDANLGDLSAVAHRRDARDGAVDWVVAGETVATSADADVWHVTSDDPEHRLRHVATDGWQFLAVGDAGLVMSSNDGRAWTTTTLSGEPDLVNTVMRTTSEWVVLAPEYVAVSPSPNPPRDVDFGR